jgi:hypothetical protein
MQPLELPINRRAIGFPSTLKEYTFQVKLRNALIFLSLNRHLEETFRGPYVTYPGRITATNDDTIGCVFQHLEMIGNLGPDLVGGGLKLRRLPELMGCFRATVFAF